MAAGTLEQRDVEDALYAAAVANGLVADDGERQCWATIRSGLSAGLQQPYALDANSGRAPRWRAAEHGATYPSVLRARLGNCGKDDQPCS